jgi:hypothetical protein
MNPIASMRGCILSTTLAHCLYPRQEAQSVCRWTDAGLRSVIETPVPGISLQAQKGYDEFPAPATCINWFIFFKADRTYSISRRSVGTLELMSNGSLIAGKLFQSIIKHIDHSSPIYSVFSSSNLTRVCLVASRTDRGSL